MKILLLGANGQLGHTFLLDGGLAARGQLVTASRDGMITGSDDCHGEVADLSDPASLPAMLERIAPDVIVNAAAYTAVDRAEQEESLATRINGEAVGVIGEWAARHDALVLHYSTDYVFDGGQSTPYAIDAPTAPLGAYGRSKLAGEQALAMSGADHLTFRTAWVYAAHGKNFLRTMLRLAGERDELRVVADQHGAPTDTALIVRGTLAALDRWMQTPVAQRQPLRGVHHLVAGGSTTWHGFASAIVEQARDNGLIDTSPRVMAIGSAEFPTPAQRPAWSLLDNSDFARRFGLVLPDWQAGLRHVMQQLTAKGS